MRVGLGYDAHPLTAGRPLVLAGCAIPFDRGLDGYSDADVACHAVIDALFGAAAIGDCGAHFPAGRPEFANAVSLTLLARASTLVAEAGFRIANVDCTIVAEEPSLASHVDGMRTALAQAMDVEPARVSVKAKRTEGLGFVGEGRGMVAYAVACLEERPVE